jgi:NADPH:quinone reductase
MLEESMRAIQIPAFADRAELNLVDLPPPVPGDDDVLIKVAATGVNFADIMMARGKYGDRLKPPYVPGFEAAGVVLATGKRVIDWQPGRRVMGTVPRHICGTYAEQAVIPAWLLMPVPENFSFAEAAAFTEVFITAILALRTFGRVEAGQNVLVHAAGGGVGTAAVQIASAMDTRVFATAGSDEKLARVKQLGADVLINYNTTDFVEAIKDATGGKGVDLILESVGGETFENNLRCLHSLGRMVVFGNSSGKVAMMKSTEFANRMISISGFSFGALTNTRHDIVEQAMRWVAELLAKNAIRPVVGKVFPLAEARAAQDYILSRQNYGKVVLEV